jgi:hypothetical protein
MIQPVVKINDTRVYFPPVIKVNNKIFKVKG